MMSQWIRISFVSILLCSPFVSQRLFADLGDFSESVEEGREEREEEDTDGEDEREFREEDEDDGFWDAMLSFTVLLWYFHNRTAWYPEYPYGNESSRPAAVGHDEKLILDGYDTNLKRSQWMFSSAGGVFLEGGDRGATANLRLTGIVGGVFGPDLEYRMWKDSSAALHFYRAGGKLPLVQSDYFTVFLDLSGAFFRGAVSVDAVALGGTFITFPFRPISLEMRGGGILSETVSFSELGVRLGVHLSRFEAYAGYYGLFYDDTGLAHQTTGLQSMELGAAVHF